MKIRRKMFFLRKNCTKDQLLVKLPIGSSEHLNAGVQARKMIPRWLNDPIGKQHKHFTDDGSCGKLLKFVPTGLYIFFIPKAEFEGFMYAW
jgi:hypothetical protein